MLRLAVRLGRAVGFVVIAVVALLLAAYAGLQTAPGQGALAYVINRFGADPEAGFQVEGIDIGWGLNANVRRIVLTDSHGAWLALNDTALRWRPGNLLGGALSVEALTVESVEVDRRPIPPTADTSADPEGGPPSIPPFRIDSLAIKEIRLDPAVAGVPLRLEASGRARATQEPVTVEAELDVRRLDESGGHLAASGRFVPDDNVLRFAIDLEEPRGGLAARLLDIDDLPAVALSLQGDGPLTDWAADLAVDLDGRRTAEGTARITEQGDRNVLTAALTGDLLPLAPPVAGAFLRGDTKLDLTAEFDRQFAPLSGQVALDTATVALKADGRSDPATGAMTATARLTVAAGGDALIALDLPDRRVAFGRTEVEVTADGRLDALNWSLAVTTGRIMTTEGSLAGLTLTATGEDGDLTGASGETPFDLTARLTDVVPAEAGLTPLAGSITLAAAGVVKAAGPAVEIRTAGIGHPLMQIALQDGVLTMEDVRLSGTVELPELAPFSALAGRPLAGALTAAFTGSGDPSAPSGTIHLDATGEDLKTGIAEADTLLTGESRLTAELGYDGTGGWTVPSLSLAGNGVTAGGSASGTMETITADITASLSELQRLDPRVVGAVEATARVEGPIGAPHVVATIESPELSLLDKPVEGLKLDADVIASPTAPSGTVTLAGRLAGRPIDGTVDLTRTDNGLDAETLRLAVGANRIEGRLSVADLDRPTEGLSGRLEIDAPNLAEVGPLLLLDLAGRLTGTVSIGGPQQGQGRGSANTVTLRLNGAELVVPGVTVGAVRAEATVTDPFGALQAEGRMEADDIDAGGTIVKRAIATASSDGTTTTIDLDARLAAGAEADGLHLVGTVTPDADGLLVGLDQADGRYSGLTTSLAAPARIAVAGGAVRIDALDLRLGDGRLAIRGTAGDTLDLDADLTQVPLRLINAVAPGNAIAGTGSGTVNVTGPANAPEVRWSADLRDVSAAPLRENGLPPLRVHSEGTLSGQTLRQTTNVTGSAGLDTRIAGTVTLGSPVTLELAVTGFVPIELARERLILSGLSGSGGARLDLNVTGPVTGPRFAGTVRPDGLRIVELGSGMTVEDFQGNLAVANSGIELRGIAAAIASGGRITAGGRVGLDGGMPADLQVRLQSVRYNDGSVVNAAVSADLALKGPLADPRRGAELSGDVNIERADISLPETLPGSLAPVAVTHRNAPQAVREQDSALRADAGGGSSDGGAPIGLNIRVNAPGKIFVRGRGLDAELGGTIQLRGTVASPQAIGGFQLIRGQMRLLTRTLTFSKGIITFTGSLMPRLDFAATSTTSSAAVTITVTGPADSPNIALTSAPQLPQDEILAQLLFDRSMSNLSPAQIAQLAASISTLTGGSREGPLGQLRQSLGLDALDIDTTDGSGAALAVGKYINDNIYLGVKQGTGGNSSRVTVDIDLSKNLKLRGEAGADGETKAGIFFEREY